MYYIFCQCGKKKKKKEKKKRKTDTNRLPLALGTGVADMVPATGRILEDSFSNISIVGAGPPS